MIDSRPLDPLARSPLDPGTSVELFAQQARPARLDHTRPARLLAWGWTAAVVVLALLALLMTGCASFKATARANHQWLEQLYQINCVETPAENRALSSAACAEMRRSLDNQKADLW